MGLSLRQCPTPTHSVPPVPSLMVAITSFITPGYMFVCYCVQSLSCVWHCDTMNYSMPGFPVFHCLTEFAQTHILWVGDVIQPSHPLLPLCPAFGLSQHQGLLQWVSSSHLVAKFGASASASVLPINIQDLFPLGLTGLISLLSKGLLSLQHPIWKASVLWHSAFFMVQLSHPYVTTGKTMTLTIQIFVGKVMPLLFNMLSRFVIAFLPRSRHLLVSWLQSPSCSDFGT